MENLPLASWGLRSWAWIIDILLVSILWEMATNIFLSMGTGVDISNAVILFIYWTILEGSKGQSIGKMAMNITVTDINGQKISYIDAAIESFGKAFLLPLDCAIGWLALSRNEQRLFNKLSHTVVVKSGPAFYKR